MLSTPRRDWRFKLHEIIFEADTPAGKAFDLVLLILISFSVLMSILSSVKRIGTTYAPLFDAFELVFTALFTIEYVLRLISIGKPIKYATSFFGIIDLLAILPTYLELLLPGSHYFTIIRIFRMMRVFRILKLANYLHEANVLWQGLRASRQKISVFLLGVVALVVILGSAMYVIEGEENGFTDIPTSIYWAIVTLSTVGYGDISPQTPLGKILASVVMLIGYGVIAVPTGIVTTEIALASKEAKVSTQSCPVCSAEGHDPDAKFCKYCGGRL